MKNSALNFIFQDWHANAGNSKGRFILILYRLAALLSSRGGMLGLIGRPYCLVYRIIIGWILGIELPLHSRVGAGLRIYHGQGLVVHDQVEIGCNVTLRHCTTIGAKGNCKIVPIIGDNVDIGSNSVILGGINIGDGSVIGAGSVVVKSVPSNVVVVGNPAKVIRSSIVD